MTMEREGEKHRIAIVRVRGNVHLRKEIKDTLNMLNLTRVNHCVVVDSRKEYSGMIKKVKDYVTWGEVSSEVVEKLIKKKGLLSGNKKITEEHVNKNTSSKSIKEFVGKFMSFESEIKDLGIKLVFRLNPPVGGYEKKGIKKPYTVGGALGYRGEKINSLLEKMI